METIYQKQWDGGRGLLATGFLQASGDEHLIAALLKGFTKLLDR
jgi:hypothetical protein